ncbi:hypothetical protein ACWDBO_51700 [Streptomyces mirabilis]|uniref:hypothetical protein n=1 Tax=Streptomyces mirabilis TaxID=68239 RepID=UPI0033272395
MLIRGETHLSDFGVEARIMPTPGHTAGSVSVLTTTATWWPETSWPPRSWDSATGRAANPPFHDDRLSNLASLRRMLALGPTKLHVGHGAPLDPERVARWATSEQRRLDRLVAKGRLRTKEIPAV